MATLTRLLWSSPHLSWILLEARSLVAMAVQPATPSYPEWDNKRTQILCVLTITTTLALVSFALRMYVRLSIIKTIGWDDYTIIAATVRDSPSLPVSHRSWEWSWLTISCRCSPPWY
jgi:hypothetical protein